MHKSYISFTTSIQNRRAHRQLSDRLVQLAVDQELSRQETEKLQELLEDLEDIESEPSTPGIDQIKNIIKRHACVDQCRLKIEELIRVSGSYHGMRLCIYLYQHLFVCGGRLTSSFLTASK